MFVTPPDRLGQLSILPEMEKDIYVMKSVVPTNSLC